MSSFPLHLQRSYYKRGFFNVTRAFDALIRSDDGAVSLVLGVGGPRLVGQVNRKANGNKTARVSAPGLAAWFQANAREGGVVNVEFVDPMTLQLTVVVEVFPLPFAPGELTTHAELMVRFGGQQYGGISTPSATPFVFLFTGEEGEAYGYHDGWDGREFLYSGEGQLGDMKWQAGNKAIRDHVMNKKRLLLFMRHERGKTAQRFLGEFRFEGYFTRLTLDRKREPRQALVFRLLPVDAEFQPTPDVWGVLTEVDQLSLESTLPVPVVAPMGVVRPSRRERTSMTYVRDQEVVAFVLGLAAGICEDCREAAPFLTAAEVPFLEVHHVVPLSEGGADTVTNAVAVCPNCHRAAHLSKDAVERRARLVLVAAQHLPSA